MPTYFYSPGAYQIAKRAFSEAGLTPTQTQLDTAAQGIQGAISNVMSGFLSPPALTAVQVTRGGSALDTLNTNIVNGTYNPPADTQFKLDVASAFNLGAQTVAVRNRCSLALDVLTSQFYNTGGYAMVVTQFAALVSALES